MSENMRDRQMWMLCSSGIFSTISVSGIKYCIYIYSIYIHWFLLKYRHPSFYSTYALVCICNVKTVKYYSILLVKIKKNVYYSSLSRNS